MDCNIFIHEIYFMVRTMKTNFQPYDLNLMVQIASIIDNIFVFLEKNLGLKYTF